MTKEYIVNEATKKNDLLLRIVPPLAAVLLIGIFAMLGNWQLNRAAEKVALAATFEKQGPYRTVPDTKEIAPFERIEVRGHFLPQRQILIDNIIRNARVGYFVITALEYESGQPLLIVNRGWIEKPRDATSPVDIPVGDDWRTLKGRAGHLPRVGIRSDESFAGDQSWPRVAVYPILGDVSEQLGRDVLPYVLLLDAEADDGFLRDWKPRQASPMTHYGYAFQWFALSLTVLAISLWQFRKKRSSR